MHSYSHGGLASISLGDSLWQKNGSFSNIEHKDLVSLTEAILINYFKPKHNIMLKETTLSMNLKTYRNIFKYSLSSVSLSFYLLFDDEIYFTFITPTKETTTILTTIKCSFTKDNSDGVLTDKSTPDFLFEIINA